MFAVPIPLLLALGFLIGIILLIIGYRETADLQRRYHLMGIGVIFIGIMIPVTPLSWYGYWAVTTGIILGLIDIAIIAIALIAGIILIYGGFRIYSKYQ